MTSEQFAAQKDPSRPLMFIAYAAQHGLLDAFKSAFGIDLFRFRETVRHIAEENLRAVRGAEVTIGLSNFEDWFASDEDEFIFPVDDDDMFHPSLSEVTTRLTKDTELVFWKHATLGYAPFEPPAIRLWNDRVLFSNNWGIRKSCLRERLSTEESRQVLSCHRTAHLTVSNWHPNDKPKDPPLFDMPSLSEGDHAAFIPDHFSLQMGHVGSVCGFWARHQERGTSGAEDIFEGVDIGAEVRLPEGLEWAAPFMERYVNFARSVAQARGDAHRTSHA